eukprot:SAG22_NODE_856_length_6839_cov_3.284570_3_plen_81_part_00
MGRVDERGAAHQVAEGNSRGAVLGRELAEWHVHYSHRCRVRVVMQLIRRKEGKMVSVDTCSQSQHGSPLSRETRDGRDET